MIALVDCNNFYASCERVFRPELINRPVAVLSNNDGCIIARSQEVKDLGIPMGAPLFKWQPLLNKHGVNIFSANFSLYGDLSERVMNTLKSACPNVEVYSIDEGFLDLSDLPIGNVEAYCRRLKDQVYKHTGIPVSIGVGPSKTLAKLANHVAKKAQRAEGYFRLESNNKSVLSKIPVNKIWGVGNRLSKRFEPYGIRTALDMQQMNAWAARKVASVDIERTVRELRGVSCIPLEREVEPRQRIMVSRSFGADVDKYEDLRAAINHYVTRASEKLRAQGSHASSLIVFVHTNVYKENQKQYKGTVEIPFDAPTDDPAELAKAATNGLMRIYKSGLKYKRGGVLLEGLAPKSVAQLSLFGSNQKSRNMGGLIDSINDKMGQGCIEFAAAKIGEKWRMNQNQRSPRYTTRWADIPTVN